MDKKSNISSINKSYSRQRSQTANFGRWEDVSAFQSYNKWQKRKIENNVTKIWQQIKGRKQCTENSRTNKVVNC